MSGEVRRRIARDIFDLETVHSPSDRRMSAIQNTLDPFGVRAVLGMLSGSDEGSPLHGHPVIRAGIFDQRYSGKPVSMMDKSAEPSGVINHKTSQNEQPAFIVNGAAVQILRGSVERHHQSNSAINLLSAFFLVDL